MSGKLILLVEDDADVMKYNKRMLEEEGFVVETAVFLAEARVFLKRQVGSLRPAAIILDIGMPDGNGLDFLRELRGVSNIPVLLLTGYGEDKSVLAGFESGCDDYLPKPYTFGILLARLKRLLQSAEQVPETITRGALSLDVLSGQAFLNGKDMLLTQKDFNLLMLFIRNEGRTMSADYLYETVWGQPMNRDSSALKNAVYMLNKKIGGSGCAIKAERNQGYRLERE